MDALHELEIQIIVWIQTLGAWLATPMNVISLLGNEEFYLLAMPTLYWCLDGVLGLRVAAILLLSNGFSLVFKLAFHQPRPYWFDTAVRPFSSEYTFGLPSAHSQNAASIWGMIALSLRRRWALTGGLVLIFLIGFSRILLGMHFITDVLLGWLLGGLLLWAFLRPEKPLVAWLLHQNLSKMIALAFTSSLVIAAAILLTAGALSGWQVPGHWQTNANLWNPEANPIDPFNLDGAFTLSGTWFGMMSGAAWLYHRQGGFQAAGSPRQRILRYLVGVAGIFVFWYLLGRVFPRSADVLSYSLRYVRYILIGLWVSALAPLLFEHLGLAGRGTAPLTAASATQLASS